MVTTSKFVNVDKYEIELTIMMTVADWRALVTQLNDTYPAWRLSQQIKDSLSKLTRSVVTTENGTF